jgi:hypothetical protein
MLPVARASLAMQDLQCDFAIELAIECCKYRPHAARPQLMQDHESANPRLMGWRPARIPRASPRATRCITGGDIGHWSVACAWHGNSERRL